MSTEFNPERAIQQAIDIASEKKEYFQKRDKLYREDRFPSLSLEAWLENDPNSSILDDFYEVKVYAEVIAQLAQTRLFLRRGLKRISAPECRNLSDEEIDKKIERDEKRMADPAQREEEYKRFEESIKPQTNS